MLSDGEVDFPLLYKNRPFSGRSVATTVAGPPAPRPSMPLSAAAAHWQHAPGWAGSLAYEPRGRRRRRRGQELTRPRCRLRLRLIPGPQRSESRVGTSEPPLSDIQVAPGVMGPATGTVARKGPSQDAPPSARATYRSVEATLNSTGACAA